MHESPLSFRDTIQARAYEVLRTLYDEKTVELQRPPLLQEFYPVDPTTPLTRLEWRIERIQAAILTADGTAASYVTASATVVDAFSDFDTRTVWLTSSERPAAQLRFTLAHELGHIVLHSKEGEKRLLMRTHSLRDLPRPDLSPHARSLERQANLFAAELLMPAKALRKAFQETFGQPSLRAPSTSAGRGLSRGRRGADDVALELAAQQPDLGTSLCELFGVSSLAMANRLQSLRLVVS